MKKLLLLSIYILTILPFNSQSQCSSPHCHVVEANPISFSPDNLTIDQGDTVVWANYAGGSHNVNADPTQGCAPCAANPVYFYSGAPTTNFIIHYEVFNTPGSYEYQCDPHVGMGMTGTIVVNPASSLPVTIDTWTTTDVSCATGQGPDQDGTVSFTVNNPTLSWYTAQLYYIPGAFPIPLGSTTGQNLQGGFPNLQAANWCVGIWDTAQTILYDSICFTITGPSAPISVSGTVSPPLPAQATDINISVSGGTPGYTYSWIGPSGFTANTQDISNPLGLDPGLYIVSVEDSNGCVIPDSFIVQQPPPPTSSWDCGGPSGCFDPGGGTGQYATLSECEKECCDAGVVDTNNVTCFLQSDGQIHVNSAWGTPPYTYRLDSINPASAGYIPSQLDVHAIWVTTNTFHTFSDTTTLSFANYSLQRRVAPEFYYYTFTDGNGCQDIRSVEIDRDGDPFVIDQDIVLVSDTGLTDGSITLNVLQGGYPNTTNYNYEWRDSSGAVISSGVNDNVLSSIGVGDYSVTIWDDGIHGCSWTDTITIGLAQPCAPVANVTHNTCPLDNQGSVQINYLAGYNSSFYQFFDSLGNLLTQDTINGSTPAILGLYSGTYTFHLNPTSVCPDTILTFEVLEPVYLSDTTKIINAVGDDGNTLCANDSTQILIDFFVPDSIFTYTYQIRQNGNPIPPLTGNVIGDTSVQYLYPGNYNIVLVNSTTAQICASTLNLYPIEILEYDLAIDGLITTSDTCGAGSGTISIVLDSSNASNMNAPFSYIITPSSSSADTVITSVFSHVFNKNTGIYSVVVEDSLGCSVDVNGVEVEEIVNISFAQTAYEKETCFGGDGIMEFTASGFNLDVDWKIWQGAVDPSDTSLGLPWVLVLDDKYGWYAEANDSLEFYRPLPIGTKVFGFDAGIYTVCVEDNQGCKYIDTLEVEAVDKPEITSIFRFPETCSGFDGSIITDVIEGDGDTIMYTIRFDTIAIAIDTVLGLYPYMNGINVWPSQAFVDTFEITYQDTNYFTNLTRGYYKIKISDEYGCEDSVTYTNYQSGFSLMNPHLAIDSSLADQLDMQISFTNMLCYDSINGTVKVLYPNPSYDYELWLYNDTLNPNLIETDFSSSIDGLVYYNELYKGIYGVQAVSHSQYPGCVVKSDTFEILEPTVISYDPPLTTSSYCLNGGYARDGGACDGILWLPNTPTGGTVDTSSIVSDTVYKYYIYRVDSSLSFSEGPYLTDSMFTGLCPGEYEVKVIDGNNCVIRDTVSLHDASLYIENFFVTNISCNDSTDASIEVFAYGGREPIYSYVWTDSTMNLIDSTMNPYINNLVEGQYFVTVYDSTGCYAIDSTHVLAAPNQLELAAKRDEYGTLESCIGESYDGSIGFEIRGGTGPYIFDWVLNNGAVSGSTQANSVYCDTCTSYQNDNIIVDTIYVLDGLTTGFYNVSLTDANGCKDTVWIPIDSLRILALNQHNPLILESITGVHDLCYGTGTGSIIIHVNDSAMWPLSYSIDSGLTHQSDSLFNNLYADTFDILVVDGYGCKATYSPFVINEYDPVVISFDTVVHTSCYGNEDGFIEITISGGSPLYSTLWENPTTPLDSLNEDIYDLGVGTYTITCVDAIGCVALDSAIIGSPEPVQLSASVISNVSCHGESDGQAVVDAVLGGVAPYIYEWEDGVQDSINTDLGEGTYYCVVTDYSGCKDSTYVVITQPHPLVIHVVDTQGNQCYGDSIGLVQLMATGGTPSYIFTNINNNNTLSSGPITFENLPEGYYSFSVEDNNGCTADTTDIKVGGNDPIVLTSAGFDLSCYKSEDGKLEIIFGDPISNTSGGVAPYAYTLTDTLDGSILQEGDVYNRHDTLTIYNLNEGTYHVAVTDYYDCFASTTISISQPDSIYAKFDPVEALINRNESIQFANQSTPSAISIWNFGDGSQESNDNSPSHTYTHQGTYVVYLVANFDGQNDECGDTAFATIKVEGYDVDNVFTPNGDNINDVFHFHDEMLLELSVSLYNRWGIKVYHWEGPQGFWDGTGYNGELLPEGVYFFTMDAVGENGNSYTEKGSVTLIR